MRSERNFYLPDLQSPSAACKPYWILQSLDLTWDLLRQEINFMTGWAARFKCNSYIWTLIKLTQKKRHWQRFLYLFGCSGHLFSKYLLFFSSSFIALFFLSSHFPAQMVLTGAVSVARWALRVLLGTCSISLSQYHAPSADKAAKMLQIESCAWPGLVLSLSAQDQQAKCTSTGCLLFYRELPRGLLCSQVSSEGAAASSSICSPPAGWCKAPNHKQRFHQGLVTVQLSTAAWFSLLCFVPLSVFVLRLWWAEVYWAVSGFHIDLWGFSPLTSWTLDVYQCCLFLSFSFFYNELPICLRIWAGSF